MSDKACERCGTLAWECLYNACEHCGCPPGCSECMGLPAESCCPAHEAEWAANLAAVREMARNAETQRARIEAWNHTEALAEGREDEMGRPVQ